MLVLLAGHEPARNAGLRRCRGPWVKASLERVDAARVVAKVTTRRKAKPPPGGGGGML